MIRNKKGGRARRPLKSAVQGLKTTARSTYILQGVSGSTLAVPLHRALSQKMKPVSTSRRAWEVLVPLWPNTDPGAVLVALTNETSPRAKNASFW